MNLLHILQNLHYFLEKLSLTIVVNLSFYILSGYLGFYMGFPTTGIFFFITLIITFLSTIICIIYLELKNGTISFIKPVKNKKELISKRFSILNYIKESISVNQILLISFIGLVCLLYVVGWWYSQVWVILFFFICLFWVVIWIFF